MKLLVISNLYPNSEQPRHGIFTEHRIRNLFSSGKVDIRVVSPVPWSPFKSTRFKKYGVYGRVPDFDIRHGINILYPRYPMIPKIGMSISPFLMALALIKPLKSLIKQGYDFDVIDAYYFFPDGVAATILGWYFNKPVVLTAYGNDISLISQYTLPRKMIQWAGNKANRITTVCKALKDRLVELGVNGEKIHVVLHGVDLKLFSPPQDRLKIREKLGLNRETLLSVGNLIERKGNHITIQALSKLPEFELLIAGDGEEEQTLKNLASSLGVTDRVRFLGHVNQDQLPQYFGAADALALVSSREGIANVINESMACGTPVIATNVWGTPEAITCPEAGVLMSDRSPQALIDAVQKLFSQYPDRAATRQFAEQFTWEKTTQRHLAVLDELGRCGD